METTNRVYGTDIRKKMKKVKKRKSDKWLRT